MFASAGIRLIFPLLLSVVLSYLFFNKHQQNLPKSTKLYTHKKYPTVCFYSLMRLKKSKVFYTFDLPPKKCSDSPLYTSFIFLMQIFPSS